MNKRLLCISVLCASSAFVTSAFADSMPHFKSGLWQMETQAGPMPITAEYCIDDATQNKMFDQNGKMGACSKPTVQQSGDTYLMETKCERNGKVNVVHSKIAFKGDKNFQGETLVNNTRLLTTGTYLGNCAPGQRPGAMNIKGPGGMNFDMADIQKMVQGLGGH